MLCYAAETVAELRGKPSSMATNVFRTLRRSAGASEQIYPEHRLLILINFPKLVDIDFKSYIFDLFRNMKIIFRLTFKIISKRLFCMIKINSENSQQKHSQGPIFQQLASRLRLPPLGWLHLLMPFAPSLPS